MKITRHNLRKYKSCDANPPPYPFRQRKIKLTHTRGETTPLQSSGDHRNDSKDGHTHTHTLSLSLSLLHTGPEEEWCQ